MTILKGHLSPETAYTVDDYPYGFRLRCKIRYWLEYHPTHGVRLMSQTTNPQRPGEAWNKPKASTYGRFGGCMYLDDENHVQWTSLHEYMDTDQTLKWVEQYHDGVPPACQPTTDKWTKAKVAFEQLKEKKRAEGDTNWPFKIGKPE